MRKELIYLSFLLMFFASCEERYSPDIDVVGGQLVVDAQITNNLSKCFVRLTKTQDFYGKQQAGVVSGASVDLIENTQILIHSIESSTGYFTFSKAPETGKKYSLRIKYDNNTYESEVVTMPPLPTILDAYSGDKVKRTYVTDAYGAPMARDTKGRDIYIDAPTTDALSYYRFSTRSIIKWIYSPPSGKGPGPPPPSVYGWQSYYANVNFNIAGPKTFSQSDGIKRHPLTWLAYDSKYYLFSDTLVFAGWILIVDQYGTSKGSYEYHEKMNSQFAADGSLFDPIQTQIYGNITCKTDPSKIVYGYFDLNSYKQYRYFTNVYYNENDTKLGQIFSYPNITDNGQSVGMPPTWWNL